MAEPLPQKCIDAGRWWLQAWTLVEGCTPCSAGCRDCWARALEKRTGRVPKPGPIRLRWDRLDAPLHWRKPRVVAVWNDLFHEDVSHEFVLEAFHAMCRARRHRFIVLTKRAGRLRQFFEEHTPARYVEPGRMDGAMAAHYPHLILGVTCERDEYLWRVEELVRTPAALRFVNAHLLGPLDLSEKVVQCECGGRLNRCSPNWRSAGDHWQHYHGYPIGHVPAREHTINWLAIECNRPFRQNVAVWWEWCRSLVQQAVAADVPVWVKQGPTPSGRVSHDLADFPDWARRRQFPSLRKESNR